MFSEYINAFETCPQENCLTSDKCEETINIPFLCYGPKQGTTCCSIGKSSFFVDIITLLQLLLGILRADSKTEKYIISQRISELRIDQIDKESKK